MEITKVILRAVLPVAFLTAVVSGCTNAAPQLEEGAQTVSFSPSRMVIMKGVRGVGVDNEPFIVERTYAMRCVNDNRGGPPQQRADAAMTLLRDRIGQVDMSPTQIGPQYRRSFELREANEVLVPALRCRVSDFTEKVVASGTAAVFDHAMKAGAMQELANER